MNWLAEVAVTAGEFSVGDILATPGMPEGSVLVVMFLLMAVPMGPAEPTALAAGLMAGAPMLPVWAVVPVLAGGMMAGDLLVFSAGGVVERRIRRCAGGARRLDRWQQRLHARSRWRDAAVLGLRMIPGARTPSVLAARGAGISTARFCLLVGAGSLLWACTWVGLSNVVSASAGGLAPGLIMVVLVVAVAALAVLRRLWVR